MVLGWTASKDHDLAVMTLQGAEGPIVIRVDWVAFEALKKLMVPPQAEDLEAYWKDVSPADSPSADPLAHKSVQALYNGAGVRRTSPIYCEHANEMPHVCPCDPDCYCKDHSCRPRCRGCSSHVGEEHRVGCRRATQLTVRPEDT